MYQGKRVSAIIPAAGSGSRMGGAESKTWLKLDGKIMIERTLTALCQGDVIDEMIVVGQLADRERFEAVFKTLAEELALTERGIPNFVFSTGGKERLDSVYQGLLKVSQTSELILIHDGARPLVTKAIIASGLEAALLEGAAVACVPSKDTIKIAKNGFVYETPDRATVYNVQTPQCFKKQIIIEAYEKAIAEAVSATDDAGLVEKLGVAVKVTEGSYENIKVTTPEDVIVAEAILKSRENKC